MRPTGNLPTVEPGPRTANEQTRSLASTAGAELARSLRALIAEIPGAPQGPKRLAMQCDLPVASASRLLRAIQEQKPVDVLLGIPGPAPLQRFVQAAAREGTPSPLIRAARSAVEGFERLIKQVGGSRSGLGAVLMNWNPRGHKQFVLGRRKAAFKALTEVKGVSSTLGCTCYAFHPSADGKTLDALSITAQLGISRSREDAVAYLGSRRQSVEDSPIAGERKVYTLDGDSVDDGLHSVLLDGFTDGATAPIATALVGNEVIHSLGHTEFGPDAEVDLVLAEVNRSALLRRGPGHSEDSLGAFCIPSIPCHEMCLDLLVHEDTIPYGPAELLVYSTVPRGPAKAGDPSRAVDLEDLPERLELGAGGFGALEQPRFPRYQELLAHAFAKLAWNPERFSTWRIRVAYPLPGSQFCIRLGK